MTFEELKEEVLVSLGGNLVDVELEDRDIRVAFKRAVRTFQQKGPNNYDRKFLRVPVTKGQNTYRLPKEIDTVVRIIKPSMSWDVESMSEFSLAAYQQIFGRTSYSQSDYLTIELHKQLTELYQRYTLFEAMFDHNRLRGTLHIHDVPEVDQIWIVECYANLCEEEYMGLYWIQEWTIAEAKEILGLAYRKFGSLPGPDGPISLDGQSLVQEARDRKQELIDDIHNHVAGDTDFTGIVMG